MDFVAALPFTAAERVYARRAEGDPLFGPVARTPAGLVELARARAESPAQNHGASTAERRAALELLAARWAELALPAASRASAQLALEPGTQLVIAGQQPALAGGPLHLFSKALSAARLARWWRSQEVPAVALFWIGDQDHDASELDPGLADPADDPRAERLPRGLTGEDLARGRVPIADLRLTPAQATVLIQRLAQPPRGEAGWHTLLVESFDPSPAVWFRNLLLGLLPEEGILPVHPAWLAPLAAPRIAAEEPGRLAREVELVLGALESAGLPVPVRPVAAVPYFWLDAHGERHRLQVDSGQGSSQGSGAGSGAESGALRSLGGGGERLTPDALAELARREPARLSPDVLLRPLMQDALLQPLAVVVGPTELAYQLELVHAYAARGIPRPLLFPRLRVRLLDEQQLAALERAGVDPARVADPAASAAALVPSAQAERIVADLEQKGGAAAAVLAALAEDPAASGSVQKRALRLEGRWLDDIAKLAALVRRNVDGEVRGERARVAAALAELWPGGADGERTLSVFYFLRRYGGQLLPRLGALYDPFEARARLLVLPAVERPARAAGAVR